MEIQDTFTTVKDKLSEIKIIMMMIWKIYSEMNLYLYSSITITIKVTIESPKGRAQCSNIIIIFKVQMIIHST